MTWKTIPIQLKTLASPEANFEVLAAALARAGASIFGDTVFSQIAGQPELARSGFPVIPLKISVDRVQQVRVAFFPTSLRYIAAGRWQPRIEVVTDNGAVLAIYPDRGWSPRRVIDEIARQARAFWEWIDGQRKAE